MRCLPNSVPSLAGAGESGMTHILGHDHSQLLLLPEAIDDYVDADNPVRFIEVEIPGNIYKNPESLKWPMHKHIWFPQINGDGEDIEACEECLATLSGPAAKLDSKGGKTSASKLTPEQRRERARKAVRARRCRAVKP